MSKKELKSKHVPVRMQTEMFAKINNLSIYYNVSIATIIRKALADYFKNNHQGDVISEQQNKNTDGK